MTARSSSTLTRTTAYRANPTTRPAFVARAPTPGQSPVPREPRDTLRLSAKTREDRALAALIAPAIRAAGRDYTAAPAPRPRCWRTVHGRPARASVASGSLARHAARSNRIGPRVEHVPPNASPPKQRTPAHLRWRTLFDNCSNRGRLLHRVPCLGVRGFTMLRTVVSQSYTTAFAVDTSGYFNDGMPVNVTPASPGFAFPKTNGRINISPAPSLSELECIRAAVRFTLVPLGVPHRYNLLEGFESFALFINPDLSVSGTILDASSQWTGATSTPNIVSPGQQHSAVLDCDGINMVRLWLDGVVVAETYTVAGAVRGIGAYGLTVGHWPDPPDKYSFEGTIFDVLLQKYDPTADLTSVLDPCCFDRDALVAWLRKKEATGGLTAGNLVSAGQQLRDVARAAAHALRKGDKARTEQQQSLAAALTLAARRRDLAWVANVLRQWQQATSGVLDTAEQRRLEKQMQTALEAFGFEWADWLELAQLFCLIPCNCGQKGAPRWRSPRI